VPKLNLPFLKSKKVDQLLERLIWLKTINNKGKKKKLSSLVSLSKSLFSEVSVGTVFAILYERNGDQWDVINDGWAEVHLYKDNSDGTFRIIAWSSTSEDVLMNSNLTHKSKYSKKAPDFHKYVDEGGKIWGFGFYHDENSTNKAKE
jgi:hypothetical protein